MREGTRVLIALGLAIIAGTAIAVSRNESLVRAADFIAPVGTLWVNAIRMTVIPLVVSLLITGVASATDLTSISRMGGRTVLVFVLLLAGTAVVVMPICFAVFGLLPPRGAAPPLPPGAAEAAGQIASGGQAQTFSTWLTSLLPPNPIAAAATGAMMPLVLFTLFLALAIARSPAPARATLLGFFQALGDAMLTLVRWVVMLAPVGVFALLLPIAAHAGAAVAGAIGFYIVAYSVASLAITLLLYPVLAVAARIPMLRFAAPRSRRSSSPSVPALPLRRCRRWSRVPRAPSADSACRSASPDSSFRSPFPRSRLRHRCRGPWGRSLSGGSMAFLCTAVSSRRSLSPRCSWLLRCLAFRGVRSSC
jgi:proton glutamate symport protein